LPHGQPPRSPPPKRPTQILKNAPFTSSHDQHLPSREEILDRLRLPAQPKDKPQQAGLLASGSLRLSTFPVAQW
jgi:hypothetical protein